MDGDRPLVVIHHSDLDGRCAAALVHRDRAGTGRYIEVDYGRGDSPEELDGTIPVGAEVWILDFSLPRERMEALHRRCRLIWIDHHRTAIEAMVHAPRIAGLQREGVAGCELTWEYLRWHGVPPEALTLLGRYDVWDTSCKAYTWECILSFQMGMKIRNTSPGSPVWAVLLFSPDTSDLYRIILDGYAIRAREDQIARDQMARAYEVTLDGLRILALNAPGKGSQRFASRADPKLHDGVLSYFFDGTRWEYHLYGVEGGDPDIDLSQVAAARGGGGHPLACGWWSYHLPVELGGRK